MNIREVASFYKNNPDFLKLFLRSLFGRSKPFYDLIFQITNICNSRCITCFNWKILNRDIDKELILEEIDRFTKKIGHLNTAGIGGGEPFLRDDLTDICEFFYLQNKIKSLHLPTNGFYTDKEI